MDSVLKICRNIAETFSDMVEKNELTYDNIEINCADLEDFMKNDIRKSVKFLNQFSKLMELKGPVLYYFEIISNIDRNEIITKFTEYKYKEGSRATPAFKANINLDTNVLYVGKVKRAFWGRVIQHLGYYTVNQTQGLQLYHWAKHLPLKLKINFYHFNPEMEDYMLIIENALAKELKPLLGKHK